jgi:tetratricopeptide (TPR) repeat protein
MPLLPRSALVISGLLSLTGDVRTSVADTISPSILRLDFDAESPPGLSSTVRDSLESVYQLAFDGRQEEALSLSDRLFDRPLTDYEAAHAYQAEGHVYTEQWELRDAIAAFQESLSLEVLSERDMQNVVYNLGRLHLFLDEPDEGLDLIDTWFDRIEAPAAEDYVEVVRALKSAGRAEEALRWFEHATALVPEMEDYRWLEWMLQLDLRRYDAYERNVKDLAGESIEDAAWMVRVASWYADEEGSGGLLDLMEWAHLRGMLDGDQQVRLAGLYLQQDSPYQAAVVLERALYDRVIEPGPADWQLLAEAWLASQDLGRAIDPLRNAAEQSGNADLYQRLGRIHLDLREPRAAEAPLRKAVTRGSTQARLLLFAALFAQGRFDEARAILSPPPAAAASESEAEALIGRDDADVAPSPVPCVGIRMGDAGGPIRGARVAAVERNAPAGPAGLEDGDLIVQYNARQVHDARELGSEVRASRPGEGFSVVVLRGDRHVSLHGTVGSRADEYGACREQRSTR